MNCHPGRKPSFGCSRKGHTMTVLMETVSGALRLPSSRHHRASRALVMRCIGAPALPRPARSPPIVRCRTPSTADIAAAHRYAWPADWPSPLLVSWGRGFALRAYWFGLHASSSRRGKVVFAPPHAHPRLHSLLMDSLEPVDTESRSCLARNTEIDSGGGRETSHRPCRS